MTDFWADLQTTLLGMVSVPGGDEVSYAETARNVTDALEELLTVQQALSQRRVEAVRAMVRSGMSYGEVAAAVGLSRQRIEQLVNR
jgi:DNA-directed RNA polymerase specialized sigma24 family protein